MLTKIKIEDNERLFYMLITLLSTLLLIDDVKSIVEDVLLVLLSLPLLRRPVTAIPLIFVASWNPMFSVFGLGAFYYYFIIFFVSMIFSHKQYGEYIGLTRSTLYYLLFGSYIAISGYFSISHSVDPALKLAITIILAMSVGLFKCRDTNYVFSCIFLIAIEASLFFFARALFNPAYYTLDEESFLSGVRPYVSQTLMTQLNPNSAAQIIVIISTIIFVALVKMRAKTFLVSILLLMNIYTLIYLGSRTSFYTLFFVIISYLIYTSNLSITRKFYLILFSAIIGLITTYYITSVGSRLVVHSLMNDYGSGRFLMWGILLENVIKDYWLHGFGFGSANYRLLGYSFDADNLYLDLLCQLGIIGFSLFLMLHIHLYRRAKSMNAEVPAKDFLTLMVINFLIIGLGESVFDTTLYWGFIAIACSLSGEEEDVTDDSNLPVSEFTLSGVDGFYATKTSYENND